MEEEPPKKLMLNYLTEDREQAETIELGSDEVISPLRKYKSIRGDEIDEAMARLINTHNIRLPIIRIG